MQSSAAKMSRSLKEGIEITKDFPKPGVSFTDFTPLHEDPDLFQELLTQAASALREIDYDTLVAVEAKGFILGGALAATLGKPLHLVRKPGLIPGKVLAASFVKEYGEGTYEMKDGALKPGDKAVVIYDILAGAGASAAAFALIEAQGAQVAAGLYVTELEYLGGRENLAYYNLISLVKIPAP